MQTRFYSNQMEILRFTRLPFLSVSWRTVFWFHRILFSVMTLFFVESRVGHVLFSAEGKDRANQVVQDMFNGTRRGCLFCFRIVISTCDVHDAFSNINVNRTLLAIQGL